MYIYIYTYIYIHQLIYLLHVYFALRCFRFSEGGQHHHAGCVRRGELLPGQGAPALRWTALLGGLGGEGKPWEKHGKSMGKNKNYRFSVFLCWGEMWKYLRNELNGMILNRICSTPAEFQPTWRLGWFPDVLLYCGE